MKHQSGRKKAEFKRLAPKRDVRNQVIHLITFGSLTSTKANVKEIQRFAEKMVTLARQGNDFNSRRRAKAILPYKEEAVIKLLQEIAPKYQGRPVGANRPVSSLWDSGLVTLLILLVWNGFKPCPMRV